MARRTRGASTSLALTALSYTRFEFRKRDSTRKFKTTNTRLDLSDPIGEATTDQYRYYRLFWDQARYKFQDALGYWRPRILY